MAKQGAGGRFVSGGEDFMPQLPMERYMNETYVKVTGGAAGAGSVTEVDTGMSVEAQGDAFPYGKKWVLYGGIYQPDSDQVANALITAGSGSLTFTVLRGQMALTAVSDLPRGDDRILMRGGMCYAIATETVLPFPLPMDRLHPMPVLSRYLTISMEHTNDPIFNALAWCVTLFWGWAGLTDSDRLAILQKSL